MIILKWEFLFFGLFFLATAAFNINEYPKIWQMNKLFSDKLTYGHMLDHSLIQSQQTKKLTRKTESVPELHKYIRNEIDLNWNSTVYINTAGLHVHVHEVQTANYVSAHAAHAAHAGQGAAHPLHDGGTQHSSRVAASPCATGIQ